MYYVDKEIEDSLYRLLSYFTPSSVSDLADLLGRIKETVKRHGLTETLAAIKTFFDHHEKMNKKSIVKGRKLPRKYFLRLLKAIPAARQRMWRQLLAKDIASRMADMAVKSFAKATTEAAREAIARRQKLSAGN